MTTVAILGGGFSGAAVAYHLARTEIGRRTTIVVVEPREALGGGLAYSSEDPAHRINVPAERMSLDTDDPSAFARWLTETDALQGDPEAVDGSGHAYPRRSLFGRYVTESLAPLLEKGWIVHRRDHAENVRPLPDGSFEIGLEHGSLRADLVVLATTHPPPAVPQPLLPIASEPGFVADPGNARALRDIGPDARVLIVGNGLTAADVAATLDRQGHRGSILMLSRHGLRSRGHASGPVEPYGDFAARPSRTALALLRHVRETVSSAERDGLTWHAVFDALRTQAPSIWRSLPERERRQLARRLRSFWDVHRFRIAPQVAGVLDRLEGEGRLRSLAASLVSSRPLGDGLLVSFRRRHGRDVEAERFDVVVNTTGPAHRSVIERQPVRSLADAGLVALDAVGLGLSVEEDHRSIGRDGQTVRDLFVAGPLARGRFGELMGLPQVTTHAQFVANTIADDLRSRRRTAGQAEREPIASRG